VARVSLRAATDELAARDPVLARLVTLVGPITHRPRDPDGPFGALVRAIVYQQLAGRAAQAIHGRVRTAVGDTFTPETLAATPDPALRAAGLSANKLASLRDLSAKVLDGTVVLTQTSRRSDEELIAGLVTVRGIGRWSSAASMSGPSTSACAQATRLPDSSTRHRPRRNSNRSATASDPTAPSSPATAGQPPRTSDRAAPSPALP
jgi:hypothetical protein